MQTEKINATPDVNAERVAALLGDWSGVLKIGVMEFSLILHVKHNDAGVLSATLDRPESGERDSVADSISYVDKTLEFEIKNSGFTVKGVLNDDGTELMSVVTQGGNTYPPFVFKRSVEGCPVFNRPQEPQLPYPYAVEDICYENKTANITLAGTLTLPPVQEPVPAVILIAGVGPQNRDEHVCGHRPFYVLADHLTRQGIAVLRVDKRGIGKSTGDFGIATIADFASDVLAGIEYLKTRKEINARQIGLIGHSEGGLTAPIVATQSKDVAFIVLMAAPGVNIEDIIYEQGILIQRAAGTSEALIAQDDSLRRKLFAIIKTQVDQAIAEQQLCEAIAQHFAELPANQQEHTPEAAMLMNSEGAQIFSKSLNAKYFRHFLSLEPAVILKDVTVPILALNGTHDLQVPLQQNLSAIATTLQEAGHTDYTIAALPNLNHLFQTSATGAPSEYVKSEETIAPIALHAISQWILTKAIRS